MQCIEFQDQITDYIDGALDDRRREAAEGHLSACPQCRRETDSIRSLWDRLGAMPEAAPNRAAMRARFDEMLVAYQGGLQAGAHANGAGWVGGAERAFGAVNTWMGSWWPRQPAVQFGMAALLFVAGLAVSPYVRPASEPPADEMAVLRAELRQTQQLVALSLMRQQSASERLRGVNWSNQIDSPGDEVLTALLNTLMRDSNVNVRLAAVEALRKFAESMAVREGAVRALSEENSPLVQSELIAFVVDFEERGATDILRRFANDPTINEGVRTRAAWGLEQFQ